MNGSRLVVIEEYEVCLVENLSKVELVLVAMDRRYSFVLSEVFVALEDERGE